MNIFTANNRYTLKIAEARKTKKGKKEGERKEREKNVERVVRL